jgi:hypothetical protein
MPAVAMARPIDGNPDIGHAPAQVRWILIAGWVASVGLVGVGCNGSGPARGGGDSFCGDTNLFHGACGGSVSGTGTTPLGSPFDATGVYVAVGSTCASAPTDHYVQYVEIAFGPAHDFARLTFADQGDGGAGAFLGSHAVEAIFKSFSTCKSVPQGMSVDITSVGVDATVDLTAGDDPNSIWSAQAGTVTGTFTFSDASGSGSASFTSPYCQFSGCP